ncbi:unnamed protein product [marine sediment metagenome]|uniref:Peptidase A2 domain-containing protein n=1 Tax=marine sediment metagenome TaxID=412755 RepID=X1QLX1_9ZZZZ
MSRYKYHLSYNFTSFNIKGSQILRPIIPVILQYDNNPPVAITMLLDSGADYSLISKDVGRSLGIDVNKDANSDVQGVSGILQEKNCQIFVFPL